MSHKPPCSFSFLAKYVGSQSFGSVIFGFFSLIWAIYIVYAIPIWYEHLRNGFRIFIPDSVSVLAITTFFACSFGVILEEDFEITESDWLSLGFLAGFIWLELFFSTLAYYEGLVALVDTFGLGPTANLFLSRFETHSSPSFRSFVSFLAALRSLFWVWMLVREALYSRTWLICTLVHGVNKGG